MRRNALFVLTIATLVVTHPFSSASTAQSPLSTRPELVLQTGHTGPINDIALAPDGRFLISAGGDSTLKIWDLSTGNVLRSLFGHTKAVLTAAVSPDGRWIASSGEDASVRVWDVITGQSRTFGIHTTLVKDVAFSADSRQLTSLAAGEMRVWEVASGRQLRETAILQEKDRLTTMPDQVVLTLTADGRFAAVAGGLDYRTGILGFGGGLRAKPIRVIDTSTGRDVEAFTLAGDIPMPTGLRFSPDGRLLAARTIDSRSGSSSSLIVYDVQTGRVLKTFQSSGVSSLTGGIEFSPDSRLLASRVGLDRTPDTLDRWSGGLIELYDVATWQRVRELAQTGIDMPSTDSNMLSVTPLTFSANGQWLAASLGTSVVLFDATSGNRLRVLTTTMKATAISAAPVNVPSPEELMRQAGVPFDPSELAALRADFGGLSGDLRELTRSERGIRTPINFTPDGTRLSVLGSDTVWDTVAGVPVRGPETAGSSLAMITSDGFTAFSPDGALSAQSSLDPSGQRGTTVVVSEVASGRVLQTIQIGKASVQLPDRVARAGFGGFDVPTRLSGLGFTARGVAVQYCNGGFTGPGGVGSAGAQRAMRQLLGGDADDECYLKTFDPRSGKELRSIRTKPEDVLSSSGRFLLKVELDTPRYSGMPGFSLFGRGNVNPANITESQPFTVVATDADTGRKLWEIKGVDDSSRGTPTFTFSPNDAVVAVRSVVQNKPALNLHDTTSGRIVGSVGIADRTIDGMTFSRDSTLMAITYGRGNSLLDLATVQSRDGRTGGNTVTVFDLATRRPRFEIVHEVPVDGATFSPDGRIIATIAQDRNQYLWDAQTGEKLATIVNLEAISFGAGTQEWLVVTPDGLFDGSPAAWQQIMWRFSQNTFDVGPVEIFFNELYYPGLASDIFAGRRPKAPRDVQQIDRRQPRLTLSQPPAGEIGTRQYAVRIDVAEASADATHAQGSGARDVRLFRNGTLVKVWPGDVLGGRSTSTLEVTLPIVAGQNRLTAYAFNRENVKSADVSTTLVGSASLSRKGTAYVLAMGVNQYENAQYNLRFAVADATAFADEVKVQQEKLGRFDRVEVIPLLDADATKSNLLYALRRLAGSAPSRPDGPAALSRLNPVEPEDAVIVYFAGHGTARGARFYLVPHDLGYAGNRTGVDAAGIETILSRSVSDLELESAVEGLAAQQLVLVIDACNSGQALEAEEKRRGPMNSKGLAQLAYEKGMYILTAAQSYQAALETSQLGHGYLTFSLVEEGLKKGLADAGQRDGQVLVREWFDYATRRVPEMQATQNDSRLLLEADNKVSDPNAIRNLQSPRAFYRRDVEAIPVVIARP